VSSLRCIVNPVGDTPPPDAWGMPEQSSNALSRPDAADYIGVSQYTLATWATRGGGPPFCRVGRRCVYLRTDLDAFLSARRVTSTADTSAAELEADRGSKATRGRKARASKRTG
jgi:hypothetical protein